MKHLILFILLTVSVCRAIAFNEGSVKVAGASPVEIHYVSAGDPSKDAILLLHGFPQFSYMWKKHMELLSQHYFVVAPDLRGYGKSSKPSNVSDYELSILAKDVDQIIRNLNLKNVTVVGHDWGGVIVHAFALRYPQSYDKLVIIDAPHPKLLERNLLDPSNVVQRRGIDYMMNLRSPGFALTLFSFPQILENEIYYNDPDQTVFTAQDRSTYRAAWTQESLTAALNYYLCLKTGPPDYYQINPSLFQLELRSNYDPTAPTYLISKPVLYMWGMQDKNLLPSLLDGIEEYVPKAQIIRVPNATHWLPSEKPQLVVDSILSFIQK